MTYQFEYDDLIAAVKKNPTQENIDNLGDWFHQYGDCYWNGEFYNADDLELWPVEDYDYELDQGEIIGYRLSQAEVEEAYKELELNSIKNEMK